MAEVQYSDNLKDLLTRLKKGYTWGANLVLNLSDAERDIFMEASAEVTKVRKKVLSDFKEGNY